MGSTLLVRAYMATAPPPSRPESRRDVPGTAGDGGSSEGHTVRGLPDLWWAFVLAFLGTLAGNLAAGVNADRLERLSALAAATVGALLLCRFALRLRVGYTNWYGENCLTWGRLERRRLRRYTICDAVLSTFFFALGLFFLLDHSGIPQLLVLSLGALAILILAGRTRRLVKRGGPPPLASLADRWAWVGDLTAGRFSPRHSRVLALVMVVALWSSFLAQGTALALRVIAGGGSQQATVSRPRHPLTDAPQAPGQVDPLPSVSEDTHDEITPLSKLNHLCGVQVQAGDGLPPKLRRQFRVAWEELSPADGCAEIAHLLHHGAYVANGHCGDELRAFGIVSRSHPAVVLLEGAADVARQLSGHEELLGASPRRNIGGGDFHFLYTEIGPFLAIREEKTDGDGGTEHAAQTCYEIEPGGAPYELLPPGMVELLVRFNESVLPSWPRRDPNRDRDGLEFFSLHTPDGVEVARAKCASDTECELRSGAYRIKSTSLGARTVTVSRFRESGPSA